DAQLDLHRRAAGEVGVVVAQDDPRRQQRRHRALVENADLLLGVTELRVVRGAVDDDRFVRDETGIAGELAFQAVPLRVADDLGEAPDVEVGAGDDVADVLKLQRLVRRAIPGVAEPLDVPGCDIKGGGAAFAGNRYRADALFDGVL